MRYCDFSSECSACLIDEVLHYWRSFLCYVRLRWSKGEGGMVGGREGGREGRNGERERGRKEGGNDRKKDGKKAKKGGERMEVVKEEEGN